MGLHLRTASYWGWKRNIRHAISTSNTRSFGLPCLVIGPNLRVSPLLSSLGPGRRETLIAAAEDDGYRFDIHLQGDRETVFFGF